MRHMHCGHGPFSHFWGRRFGPTCDSHDGDRDQSGRGDPRGRFGGVGHHRRRGPRGLLDYGDLRLLVLAMLADAPRHGYELMKAIGESTGGSYQPSPGVIYPTLSWLEDMGFSAAEAEQGGRKRYRITDEGRTFLAANEKPLAEIFARVEAARDGPQADPPAEVIAAMEDLKLALRQKLQGGGEAEAIAAALRTAAAAIRNG